jgi:hypothetical protein
LFLLLVLTNQIFYFFVNLLFLFYLKISMLLEELRNLITCIY